MKSTAVIPIATLVALLAGAQSAEAQNKFWVDVASGDDVSGTGTSANPYQTITHCAAVAGAGQCEIIVRPGNYTWFTGEMFPIVMPPSCEMYAEIPGTVLIATTVISAEIPKAVFIPAGSQYSFIHDLKIYGNAGAIVTDVQANDFLTLRIERCELSGGMGLWTSAEQGQIDITVADTKVTGGNMGAKLHAASGALAMASFTNCEFWGGNNGLQAGAQSQASSTVAITNCNFHDQSFGSIISFLDLPGSLQLTVDHSVFEDIGAHGNKPVIKDSSVPATWTIQNCAFWNCDHEITNFGPTYTVDHCSFASMTVPGVGNFIGDPKFVDAANNDYHLLPTSPAIDAGVATLPALDVDGEPFDGHPTLSGPPVADIGQDEFYAQSFYFDPSPISLVKSTKLRCVGPANSIAFLLVSTSLGNSTFGPHYQLGALAKFGTIGTLDATGTLSVTFPALLDLQLLGVTAYAQVAYLDPLGHGHLSYDHQTITFWP